MYVGYKRVPADYTDLKTSEELWHFYAGTCFIKSKEVVEQARFFEMGCFVSRPEAEKDEGRSVAKKKRRGRSRASSPIFVATGYGGGFGGCDGGGGGGGGC